MKKMYLFLALLSVVFTLSAQQPPKPLTLTSNTHFVQLPNDCEWISDIEDGVWVVERHNACGFFLDDGHMLFDFAWATGGGYRSPQMNGGAILMYRKEDVNSQKPMYLLYRDGTAKEMPAEYIGPATNFVDGVALIRKKTGNTSEYVYVNVSGQRVYGNLTSLPDRFDNINMTIPPLKEGLRAYKQPNPSGFGGKWGYIDATGKVIIPARFDKCRSFSEGYALVEENREIYFIDKKGNKAIAPYWEDDTYFNDVSDVHDGYFTVNYSPRSYYNTQGKKMARLNSGSPFYGGYCFAEDSTRYNGKSRVYDKNFKSVRVIPEVDLWWNDEGKAPIFTEAGVATVKQERVLAPDGTILIQHYPAIKKSPNQNSIGAFSRSGFAKATLTHNGSKYEGFINMDGEFVIVYRWNREVELVTNDPNNPWPCDTCRIVIDPIPPIPGPTPIHRVEYNVTVIAAPSEGGTVSGSGKYHLGDRVPLMAMAKEGWKFYKWESQTVGYYNSTLPENVIINGTDLAFVASFLPEVEKDSIEDVDNTGSYCAHKSRPYDGTTMDYDVYMEMSMDKKVESPYGKETYGFLACVLDGNKVYSQDQLVNGKQSTITWKMFFVPMKISGLIKEKDGKRYLVLDGGQFMVSDLRLGNEVPAAAAYFNMIMGSEGTLGTVSDGRYRLELTEYDEETGECTFGELYRFHPDFGWMLTDDYPSKTTNTFYGSKTIHETITGDFFRGLKMKICPKRTVEFAPPQGWVKASYADAVSNLFFQMSTIVTDWEKCFNEK